MMPISAIGNRTAAGFSLVELMMVLVILSLAAGAVLMVLPNAGGPRAAGEKLAARLMLASQYAILHGEPVGLVTTADGYRFERFRLGAWQTIMGEEPLAPGVWPEDSQVTLEGESKQAVDDLSGISMPVLWFDPTGGGTAFRLTLVMDGRRYVIAGDEGGKLEHGDEQAL